MFRTSRYLLLCFIAMTVLFAACKKDDTNAVYQPAPTDPSKALLLELVNKYRTAGCNCGTDHYPPVAAVSWNDQLEQAAKDHSDDMNNKNYFDHTGSDGSSAGDRITRRGYSWKTYGENIAKGYATEQAVIEGWIKSPGHCKNIMNGNFKEMGVAASGVYWTQELAARQ